MSLPWDFPAPFVHEVTVAAEDIDRLGHVNNARYVVWLEQTAWAHAEALGAGWSAYEQHGCIPVAHRHEIDYLKPAFDGDRLQVATWCTANDGKLRMRRHYQIIRPADGAVILRALTHWISADLRSGRPRRMPAAFVEAYAPIPEAPE